MDNFHGDPSSTSNKRGRESETTTQQPDTLHPPVSNDEIEQSILDGVVDYLSQAPSGYRFAPSDDELIRDYLWKKINNVPLGDCLIHSVDLYSNHPRYLSGNHLTYPGAHEWYFFTPRQRKYPNGKRPNRSTGESGYWKATGADKEIKYDDRVIGHKKSLVFYEGDHKSNGGKTNWIMHEYRITGPPREKLSVSDMRLDDWVLCRLVYKDSRKPRRNNAAANDLEVNDENSPSPEVIDANHNNLTEAGNGLGAPVVANVQHPVQNSYMGDVVVDDHRPHVVHNNYLGVDVADNLRPHMSTVAVVDDHHCSFTDNNNNYNHHGQSALFISPLRMDPSLSSFSHNYNSFGSFGGGFNNDEGCYFPLDYDGELMAQLDSFYPSEMQDISGLMRDYENNIEYNPSPAFDDPNDARQMEEVNKIV